jgi:hypothetical protein
MTKSRALKDAAKDPLAKKQPNNEKNRSHGINFSRIVLTVAGAFLAGILGGLLTGRFIRFRL